MMITDARGDDFVRHERFDVGPELRQVLGAGAGMVAFEGAVDDGLGQ